MGKHKKIILVVICIDVLVFVLSGCDDKKAPEREKLAFKMDELYEFLSNLSFEWHDLSKNSDYWTLYNYLEEKAVEADKYQWYAYDASYYLLNYGG